MGSICSKIRDDYDDYVEFCKIINEEPLSDRGEKSFYKHSDELCSKHGYKKTSCWFEKVDSK